MRITYGGGEITFESNLGEGASAQAIGDAMERLGRSVGAEEQARAEVAGLRKQQASVQVLARAMAQMVSEINATLSVPDVDVDLGEWIPATSN